MDRSLFFITMSLLMFWLVVEDLFGSKKHISSIVKNMLPNVPSVGSLIKDKVKDTVKDVKKDGKDFNDGKKDGRPDSHPRLPILQK